jgi:uncharacterized protein HemX
MNNDHTRMTAKLRTDVCGRVSSGVSALARAGMVCVLALATVGAVQAQDRGGFRKDDLQQAQQQRHDDRGERNNQRQDAPRYEPRQDDGRRQQQDHNADAQRRSGRLTPDERRDLRRQINEAGVDLYPNTPRR